MAQLVKQMVAEFTKEYQKSTSADVSKSAV